MGVYVEDWSGHSLGSGVPAGWSARWVDPYGLRTEVISDTEAPGGQALLVSAINAGRRALTFDAVDGDPDRLFFDAIALIRYTGATPNSIIFTLIAASGGGEGSETGTAGGVNNTSSGRQIRATTYNSGAAGTNYSTPYEWENDTLYWLRLTREGDDAVVRLYEEHSPMGTPLASATTPIRTSATGRAGFMTFGLGAETSILWYGIGTGSDTAPLPPGYGSDPPTGKPEITDITSTHSKATVTYSTTGVSGAESYQYRLDAGAALPLAESPADITGLEPETQYMLEIRAVNEYGAGEWSDPEPFTTTASPVVAPAGSVTVIGVSPVATSAEVEYTYDNDDETGFEYRLTVDQVPGDWKSLDPTPAIISDLDPDTDYSVEVRAVNTAGAGAASTAVPFKTLVAPLQIEWLIDTGCIDPGSINIINPSSSEPVVEFKPRITNGTTWIFFHCKLVNAKGKRPTFRVNIDKRWTGNIEYMADWRPVYTADHLDWVSAPSRTIVDKIAEWQFSAPFTDNEVYVADHPVYRKGAFDELATRLLADQSGLVSVSAGADAAGVIGVTPAETDDLSRQVGGNNQYGFVLGDNRPTTDGGPKRWLIVDCGVHAGEILDGWVLEGIIDYFIDGTGADANRLRANWNIGLYFAVTPNGRLSGHWRGNPSMNRTKDPNRDWGDTGAFFLTESRNVRNAILTDLDGGQHQAGLSLHTAAGAAAVESIWPWEGSWEDGDGPVVQAAWDNALDALSGISWNRKPTSVTSMVTGWHAANGAKLASLIEIGTRQSRPVQHYRDCGGWAVQAISAVDAQGLFYQPIDGSAEAQGDLSAVYLSPSSGVASGGGRIDGSIAEVSLTSPSGVASGDAVALGVMGGAYAQAPEGAAQVGSGAFGAVASMYASAPNGIAVGGATAHSAVSPVELSAPTGIAVGAGSSVAAGAIAPVILFAPLGTASSYEPPEPPIPVPPQGNDFYSQMAAMTRELLAPTSMGGLGQGMLGLTRVTPGVPDPDQPWLPVQPVRQTVTLRGAVRGIGAELVGANMNGTVLVASDRQAICAVPSIDYTAGDVLTVDGVPVHVIAVENIPAAGIRSAVRFYIRG